MRTLASQLWTAHDAKAKPSPALAPGEAFPSASAELRRRLVTSKVDPFVGSPPGRWDLRLDGSKDAAARGHAVAPGGRAV